MPLWKLENSLHAGIIKKPYSYLGEIRVAFFMPSPEKDITEGSFIFIEFEKKPVPFLVEEIRWTSAEEAILKLADVEDDKAAALVAGREVYVDGSKISTPKMSRKPSIKSIDSYKVETEDGTEIGRVAGIMDNGIQSLLEIEGTNGKEILIPIHEDLILKVDDRKKAIIVSLPEGLLDL